MESKKDELNCIYPVFFNTWTSNISLFISESYNGEKIADAWQRDALEKHEFHKHTITLVQEILRKVNSQH